MRTLREILTRQPRAISQQEYDAAVANGEGATTPETKDINPKGTRE